jgi:hypothetical protein
MKPRPKQGGGPITPGAIIPGSAFTEGQMPAGQIYAAGGAVRGKSVGSDLAHWKEYASRNKPLAKGGPGENAGVPLSEPNYQAPGAKAKGRADRAYAKGGRVKRAKGGRVANVGSKITGGAETGVGRAQEARRASRFR